MLYRLAYRASRESSSQSATRSQRQVRKIANADTPNKYALLKDIDFFMFIFFLNKENRDSGKTILLNMGYFFVIIHK